MEGKDLKMIEIVLENCEVIPLAPGDLCRFWLDDISFSLCINTIGQKKYVSKTQSCRELLFALPKQTDRHYEWLGERSQETIFQRLSRPDITAVELSYEDGTSDYIVTPWNGETEWENRNQTTVVGQDGTMYVVVSQSRTASTVVEELRSSS